MSKTYSSSDEMAGRRHGGNLQAAAAIANCSAEHILDFSASLNPLGPPQSVWEAIANAREAVIRYPDPDSTRLRQALSNHYGINSDWIVPGNGAAELFTWAARSCSQLGITLIPQPAFSDYARALEAVDASWEGIACWQESSGDRAGSTTSSNTAGQFADLGTAIRARLSQADPPTCLILTNPHNPTGHLWTAAQLQDIIPRFQLVILDEAFMDFVAPSQSLLPYIDRYPQLVVIRSLTKFYAIAGLRIGFAVTHPQRGQQWQQWRDPWSVNGLATEAAVVALKDMAFQRQTLQWLPQARQQLSQGIQNLEGCIANESKANFLLVNVDRSVTDLQEKLLKNHHILIRDCLSFKHLGDRFFRVAVRSEAENLKLLRSLKLELSHPSMQSTHYI
ncbi:MAG: threonine-phosphate decarboxylase CobD [Cyanobacteria bacterium P01_E01_bin.34]